MKMTNILMIEAIILLMKLQLITMQETDQKPSSHIVVLAAKRSHKKAFNHLLLLLNVNSCRTVPQI